MYVILLIPGLSHFPDSYLYPNSGRAQWAKFAVTRALTETYQHHVKK